MTKNGSHHITHTDTAAIYVLFKMFSFALACCCCYYCCGGCCCQNFVVLYFFLLLFLVREYSGCVRVSWFLPNCNTVSFRIFSAVVYNLDCCCVHFLFCFHLLWIIRWFAFIFVLCKRCHKYICYKYEYLCVSCENGKRTIPNLSLILKKKNEEESSKRNFVRWINVYVKISCDVRNVSAKNWNNLQ